MPARAVLNMVYAMAIEKRDEKGRKEFDDKLYGWSEINDRANQELTGGGES
jgi:hypothetical protein